MTGLEQFMSNPRVTDEARQFITTLLILGWSVDDKHTRFERCILDRPRDDCGYGWVAFNKQDDGSFDIVTISLADSSWDRRNLTDVKLTPHVLEAIIAGPDQLFTYMEQHGRDI